MITVIVLASVVLAAFLLLTAIRAWQRERLLLYLGIPVVLGFALVSGWMVNSLLGYPTTDLSDLQEEFVYVTHTGRDPIYLLAVPFGSTEPRLYVIPSQAATQGLRQALNNARIKAGKGVSQAGRMSPEGAFEMHDFRHSGLPPKDERQ